jgi:hypothetical protein
MVVDPTVAFPGPTAAPPKWTVADNPAAPSFTSHGYGDGSRIYLCGPGTARAAFAIIQLGGDRINPIIINCLMGPLDYPIQDIQPAELTAFLFFICNTSDDKVLIFYTDCEWVLNGFETGEFGTTQAAHVLADIWRKVWRALSKRKFPISVKKVKAHTKSACLSLGSTDFLHREGNLKKPTAILS